MLEGCSNVCTRAIIAMEESALFKTTEDFLNNLEENTLERDNIVRFYDYIAAKHHITCEAGMLFVERALTRRVFDRIFQKEDPQNMLVNAKISLYSWLKPAHLKVEVEVPERIIKDFKALTLSKTPSVKTSLFMAAISNLHDIIGKGCDHDTLFTALIYCFIKTQTSDLVLHFKFMKLFYRPYSRRCEVGCSHGFSVSVRCSCLYRENWNNEEEYYLVVAMAALEYIRMIEYYNLSVSVAEFNMEISDRLKSIKFASDKKA